MQIVPGHLVRERAGGREIEEITMGKILKERLHKLRAARSVKVEARADELLIEEISLKVVAH
jgi:hypothetical protein